MIIVDDLVMTGGTLVQCAKVSKTLVTCKGEEYGYLCYQCLNRRLSRLEKSFVSDSTHFSPEPRYWLREEADDHAPRA